MCFYRLCARSFLALAVAGCADRVTAPVSRGLVGPSASVVTTGPTNLYLGDITLSGGSVAYHAPQFWALENCSLTLHGWIDMTGLKDVANAHAWTQIGVRDAAGGDFNPAAGHGVWLATDYDWAVGTFGPDSEGAPSLDMDDKFLVQKAPGGDESAYDLYGFPPVSFTPPVPGNNYGFWFDRDGVDQWQAQSPLAVNGYTYNTHGQYFFALDLHSSGPTSGTAVLEINSLRQGFENDGNWDTIDFPSAGMTFSGDMNGMQVFYGLYGYGATHTVTFRDVIVSGCLVLTEGMATGGGWFVPEAATFIGGNLDGSRASFQFNAKQKDMTSSGELNFRYAGDGLSLESTSYDWVTVSAGQVMFEGTGTLNGTEIRKFRVRAVDGDKAGGADRFEIRIWPNEGSSYNPAYRAEGSLGGGQVVVHKN